MDATLAKFPPAIRWIVAAALLLVGAFLVMLLLRSSSPAPAPAASGAGSGLLVHTVCLLAVALAVYAWVLYPMAGSLLVSAVVGVALVWAWAAYPDAGVGSVMSAFGILVATAVWQQRVRLRRFHRMEQIVEDLGEEQTVKDQAIELAQQGRDTLQKKLSRYTQLQTIAEELSNMTNLAQITQFAVDRAFSLIGKSDVCLLFLVDAERQELSLFASRKRHPAVSVRAKHGDQFDRYVLRTHAPLLVNDARRDFRFTMALSSERDVSAVIACPLMLAQRPAGVLRLDSPQPGTYTQDDLRFLDILLDLASTAVTNAKLFAQTQQLAMTDGLTGLMLRRPFLEQLTRELSRAGRSREAVSVAMLDVDHFKRYNDTFGHMAGDLILKETAELLRAVVPPGGLIARYGGEEFIVLLPRVPRQEAAEVAEKIRRVVEQQGLGSGRVSRLAASKRALAADEASQVTVSLGVASFPQDAQAELELIRAADERLYRAKRDGRNRVCSS